MSGRRRRLVFAFGVLSALLLVTGAQADRSYTDTRNDAQSGPDIVGATVRHDDAGTLVFQIATSNFPATNHVVSLYFDVDGDRTYETWIWAGRAWSENIWGIYVWNGSQWVHRPHSSFRAAGVGGQVTEYRVSSTALGLPSPFSFLLESSSVDYGSSGWQTVDWDRAPDSGGFTYELTSSSPAPEPKPTPKPSNRVAITKIARTPSKPIAGQSFTVSATVARVGRVGKFSGIVYCDASIEGRRLRWFGSVRPGGAACRWDIAENAAGKMLKGSIGVNESGGPTVTRRFSERVISVGPRLFIEGGISAAPSQPTAGQKFYYRMGIAVRRGSDHKRISDGKVICRATIAGRLLPHFQEEVKSNSGIRCGWNIPSGTAGQTMIGLIVVRSEGGVLTHRFTRRVR